MVTHFWDCAAIKCLQPKICVSFFCLSVFPSTSKHLGQDLRPFHHWLNRIISSVCVCVCVCVCDFYHSFEDILLFSNHQSAPRGQTLIKINSLLRLTLKVWLQWSNMTDRQYSLSSDFTAFIETGSLVKNKPWETGCHIAYMQCLDIKTVICSSNLKLLKVSVLIKCDADSEVSVSLAGWGGWEGGQRKR